VCVLSTLDALPRFRAQSEFIQIPHQKENDMYTRESSGLVKWVSLATARNPEVVMGASPAEKARVGVEALMLLALGALVFVQWQALLGEKSTISGVIGALVFTCLFLGFDFLLGASIERQSAQGNRSLLTRLSIASRIAMSAIGATVLSTAWALNQFAPDIDNRNRISAAAINAPLQAKYDARSADQHKRLLAPIEAKIADKKAEKEKVDSSIAAYRASARSQSEMAATAAQEASRQQFGVHGADAGQGRLYGFAQAQRESAERAAKTESTHADSERLRAQSLEKQLTQLDAERARATASLSTIETDLQKKLLSDPGYVVVGTDFLSRFRGLRKLMADPVDGLSVTLMLLAVWGLFVTLELSYLLAKLAHHGMTYAQRDMLRELRDLEQWAQSMRLDMSADTARFLRKSQLIHDEEHSPNSGRTQTGSRLNVIEIHPRSSDKGGE